MQGKFAEAAELQAEVLEAKRRVLGVEHRDTLMAVSTLAAVYSNWGKLNEAVVLQEEVLATRRRVLGDCRPPVHAPRWQQPRRHVQQTSLAKTPRPPRPPSCARSTPENSTREGNRGRSPGVRGCGRWRA